MSAPTGPARVEWSAEQVAGRLVELLSSRLTAARELRIDGLVRTSSGFSRENWVFDAVWLEPDGTEARAALILRRDPPGSVLATDRAVEFAVLSALRSSEVPAPVPRWLDATGEWFGRPSVIMDREEGDCDWFVLNGDRPLEVRRRLAEAFCRLLVSVHGVEWQKLGLGEVLGVPGPGATLAAVDLWEGELHRHQLEPHPELEVVAAWLRAEAPESAATVLVHGDFKPGNALLRGDDVGVLLDWELAHLGDHHEDLGWITNPVRAREHQIPGVWEREQILAAYAHHSGRSVDPEAVRWWNVLANYKLAVISLTGTAAFVDGRFDRLHHVPVGLYRVMFELAGI